MLGLIIFLLGGGMLVLGAASYFEIVPSLIDFQHHAVELGPRVFSLDIFLIMLGVLFVLISWVLKRLGT